MNASDDPGVFDDPVFDGHFTPFFVSAKKNVGRLTGEQPMNCVAISRQENGAVVDK